MPLNTNSLMDQPEHGPQVLPWYAVRLRPNVEKTAAKALRSKDYDEFLPLYRTRRRWSDRYVTADLPLFPGYLFCRIDLRKRLPLLTTPGVIEIVSSCGAPVPVDEAEIAAVQSVVRSALPAEPWLGLAVGERVRIQEGPLRGLQGVLQQANGACRLLVSVTLLHRSVSVQVDRSWVYPLAWEEHPISRLQTAASQPA
jgi:transcription antitermination factor NusG